MEVEEEIVDYYLSDEEENNLIEVPLEISKKEFKKEIIINIVQSKGFHFIYFI